MHNHSTLSPDWAALARYLSGESDPGEADAVRRWIAVSPERAALVDGLREVWAEAAVPRDQWSVEAALPRIMNGDQPTVDPASRRRTPPWRYLGRGVAAAAAVALLAVGVALWRPTVSSRLPSTAVATRAYATQRGQYATIMLVDGTRITLAPLSELRVPRGFEGAGRDVYLKGQALFKVTHHPTRTFRVYAANAVATDLGTTFVVRSYEDMPRVDVMVTEGVVSLASRSDSATRAPSVGTGSSTGTGAIVLRPGDLGRVSADGAVAAEHGVAAEAYTAWAEGRLVFRRTPLREVAAELARWYDLDVRIPDSAVAARRVTASFDGEPAVDVLRFVALSLGLSYERRGRTVILAPQDSTE